MSTRPPFHPSPSYSAWRLLCQPGPPALPLGRRAQIPAGGGAERGAVTRGGQSGGAAGARCQRVSRAASAAARTPCKPVGPACAVGVHVHACVLAPCCQRPATARRLAPPSSLCQVGFRLIRDELVEASFLANQRWGGGGLEAWKGVLQGRHTPYGTPSSRRPGPCEAAAAGGRHVCLKAARGCFLNKQTPSGSCCGPWGRVRPAATPTSPMLLHVPPWSPL